MGVGPSEGDRKPAAAVVGRWMDENEMGMDENEMDLGSLCVIDGMTIRRNQYTTGSRLFVNTRYPTPDTQANWLG